MGMASRLESYMLKLINAERDDVGLKPLSLDRDLNEAAEQHSEWMLRADKFSHTGKNGSDPEERMVDAGFSDFDSFIWGENIAWTNLSSPSGYKDDVRELHNNLMDSLEHRDNILDKSFREIGIGIEIGNFDGWDSVIVTQDFAWDLL